MNHCCEDKSCVLDALRQRQAAVLKTVLAINAVMFVVVLVSALRAGSVALLSDSLDNLGDALTYAVSLYAVSRSLRTKAKVAFLKGALILAAGLAVAGEVAWKILHPALPTFEIMGVASLAALAANGVCLLLLTRHREDDINMSSVWECSRNDIAANVAVFVAAGGVWLTASGWPDIAVGAALAVLFLRSAARVLAGAISELRKPPPAPAASKPVAVSLVAMPGKRR
ncbi:MAG TPA: cation transporter [Burkholderiales bacterium]|nr:cation transporter [Burkholderiales bacterium]